MVSVSQFTLTAEAYDPATATGRALSVKSIKPSLDIERVPYLEVELVIAPTDATTFAWLDPRGDRRVRWRIDQAFIGYTSESGATSATLPATGWGMCCIRRRRRRLLTGEITLTLAGFDALMGDKRRISATTVDTAAANVKALVDYAVARLVDSYTDINTSVVDSIGASAVTIPAGDRRVWSQGETLADLYHSELDAAGGRLLTDTNGNRFKLDSNTRTVGAGLLLLLYTGDYTGVLDGSANARILGDPEETTDREQWADGELVRFTYTNSSGVQITSYQASSGGANKRGDVTERNRAAPSTNIANGIAARMKTRGVSYSITAEIDLGVFPLMTCAIRIGNAAAAIMGKVTAVEWDLPEGTMTVQVKVE